MPTVPPVSTTCTGERCDWTSTRCVSSRAATASARTARVGVDDDVPRGHRVDPRETLLPAPRRRPRRRRAAAAPPPGTRAAGGWAGRSGARAGRAAAGPRSCRRAGRARSSPDVRSSRTCVMAGASLTRSISTGQRSGVREPRGHQVDGRVRALADDDGLVHRLVRRLVERRRDQAAPQGRARPGEVGVAVRVASPRAGAARRCGCAHLRRVGDPARAPSARAGARRRSPGSRTATT